MKKKLKGTPISKELVGKIMAHESGSTVSLSPEVWPEWAKKARDPKVDHILFCPSDGPQKGKGYDFDEALGRLTVIREDPKDVIKGFPYNKDIYVFVHGSDKSVVQYGPFKKGISDHWMSILSDEYKGWPVVGDADEEE